MPTKEVSTFVLGAAAADGDLVDDGALKGLVGLEMWGFDCLVLGMVLDIKGETFVGQMQDNVISKISKERFCMRHIPKGDKMFWRMFMYGLRNINRLVLALKFDLIYTFWI
jgi:hypothetical protein